MAYYPRIKDLRIDADMTQTQVGEYLGIDQRVYSNYETGKRTIPVEYLIQLAKLYNTSLDYLVGLATERNPR